MAEIKETNPSNFPANQQPSIFEVLAHEYLSVGLRNAFYYLSNVLVDSNPAKYVWLRSWFDEVYLLLDLIVQASHLTVYNASFSEKFYGLRRVSSSPTGQPLKRQHYVRSILLLTTLPYLRKKLDLKHNSLRRSLAEQANDDRANNLSSIYLMAKAYSLLNVAYETITLIHQVRFAVGLSRQHSPLLKLAEVELQTFVRRGDASVADLGPYWQLAKWTTKALQYGLSMGAFSLQFLEFFYARDDTVAKLSRLPVPVPPQQSITDNVTKRSKICPLCHQGLRNDTALATCGFVYCYSCIHSFLERNKKCPVTGVPASQDNLIKLYPPAS